ncbi:universal stress protein [Pontibacter toksunensis]|uniref:Universal stress protein n=1 Tax=Pontibacter toksunensis TaxID=1332631 RepID=A0ABW6C3A1_9BACT
MMKATNMKTILVPTDFSKEADNAFLYAVDMARKLKADILLFHAFHHPIFSPFPYNEDEKKLELREEKLEQLQTHICKLLRSLFRDYSVNYNATGTPSSSLPNGFYTIILKGKDAEADAVYITCVCTFGLTTEEILKACNVYNANLVVMGMRGAGAISQALIGSTTTAIILNSEVPVLSIPAHRKFEGLKSIVAAVNLANLPDLQLLAPLRTIVKAFESKLHVLHLHKEEVLQEEQDLAPNTLEKLHEHLSDIDLNVQFKRADEISQGIQDYVQEQQADLLVLIPGENTFLNRLLSKTTTMQVAAKAYVPLLTLPTTAPEAKPTQERADKNQI